MKRFTVKTPNGFRVYGAFTCIMDIDSKGKVVYSNVNNRCKEYLAMFRTFVNSPFFVRN